MSRFFARASAKIGGVMPALTAGNGTTCPASTIEAPLATAPRQCSLLPEEDVIADPDDDDDEIDDLLPADLWF